MAVKCYQISSYISIDHVESSVLLFMFLRENIGVFLFIDVDIIRYFPL